MHILISNDDGIFAPGIQALAKAAASAGHRVTVYAPDGQRSASAHSVTLHDAIRVRRVDMDCAEAYSVSGTPADSARIGLYCLRDHRPDFMLSGINCGPNRGDAITYSGTIGAALEGTMAGVPSMAVSLCSFQDCGYDPAARLAVRMMEWAVKNPLPRGELYNLNIPEGDIIRGVRRTVVPNSFQIQPAYIDDGDGNYFFAQGKEELMMMDESEETRLIREGYATLSILTWNLDTRKPIAGIERVWGNE